MSKLKQEPKIKKHIYMQSRRSSDSSNNQVKTYMIPSFPKNRYIL